VLVASAEADAADTVEIFDKGPSDAEFYVGLDGLKAGSKPGVYGEYLAGFGLVERLSAYLTSTVALDGAVSAGFGAGIFGTPVDRDHFDLDLALDVGSEGPGLEGFSIGPALEMNFDLEPDLALFGAYLRAGTSIEAYKLSSRPHEGHRPTLALVTAVGAYLTLAERHQILLELDAAFHPLPRGEDRAVEVGGAALGYNVALGPVVELITEVFVDIPMKGESLSAGLMVGVILTLPSDGTARHM
jgi:hypothetical protein